MLWGTVTHYKFRPKCRGDCDAMVGRCHGAWAQRGGKGEWKNDHTQIQLYSMPKALCLDIVKCSLMILDYLEPNELYT